MHVNFLELLDQVTQQSRVLVEGLALVKHGLGLLVGHDKLLDLGELLNATSAEKGVDLVFDELDLVWFLDAGDKLFALPVVLVGEGLDELLLLVGVHPMVVTH